MNDSVRTLLGVVLILIGIFYRGGGVDVPVVNPKLEKPSEEVVELVASLFVPEDGADSNKLAGMFFELSEADMPVSRLTLQYMLDFVGREAIKDELKPGGVSKYPQFAPSAASAMQKVIGPQTLEQPLTFEEQENLKKLFYGFAWKLYSKEHDKVFEDYKVKTVLALAKYNGEKDDDDVVDDCPCNGSGWITHGDGHRTRCPCVADGGNCTCKSTQKPEPEPVVESVQEPVVESAQEQKTTCPCETKTTYCNCKDCKCNESPL